MVQSLAVMLGLVLKSFTGKIAIEQIRVTASAFVYLKYIPVHTNNFH